MYSEICQGLNFVELSTRQIVRPTLNDETESINSKDNGILLCFFKFYSVRICVKTSFRS